MSSTAVREGLRRGYRADLKAPTENPAHDAECLFGKHRYEGGPDFSEFFGAILVPRYPATTRVRALVREPYAVTDTLEILLPAEFEVVELPKDAGLESEFGTCTTRWQVDGTTIRVRRELFWKETDLPAARYKDFKTFLAKVARAYSPAVLVKKRSGA